MNVKPSQIRTALTAAARAILADSKLTAAQAARIFHHRPDRGPHGYAWGTCGNALECRGVTTPHPDPCVRYELTGLGYECQRLMHEAANEKWDEMGLLLRDRGYLENDSEALAFARKAAQRPAEKFAS